jgi:DNA-directed RNA polymerase specialized sigma subunit
MKHTIEINTVDALLIVQLLHDNHFENVVDKAIAERLRNEIIEKVGKDLYESVNKDGNQTDDGRLLWIDTIGTEDENLETLFNSSEDVGLGDLIHRAIDAKEFDIIRNSLLNGFNDKEVGEMVNRSSERIRQRRDRAMKKIAQEIKKEQKRNGYVYNNNVDTCRIDRVFSK